MSGDSIVVDTNILIYLLNGNKRIYDLLDGNSIWVSCITEMELLGFPELTQKDYLQIKSLLDECRLVDLNRNIKDIAIDLRRKTRLKLPDAIVAATAIFLDYPLLTADKIFANIPDLTPFIIEL